MCRKPLPGLAVCKTLGHVQQAHRAYTVECVHGYDAKCWAWYAPYECPTSTCTATNDDEWGKPCLAPGVLDNCYGKDTACGPGPNAAPAEGGGGGGSKKKKKSSNDSLALGLGLGLGLGGLLLIGLIAALCLSKKKQKSTATREQDVENEMVKTGAAMS